MKDVQGMIGTTGALLLRLCEFAFAAVSLCVMATTSDFPSVTAFRYLVAAVGLQCLWSLSLALTDVYALLVRRSFRDTGIVSFFAIGDKEADEWMEREVAKDIAQSKVEQMKEIAKLKAKEEKRRLESEILERKNCKDWK